MFSRFQIPLHTFTVPTKEKNKNISVTISLGRPCKRSQSQRMAGCIMNANATAAYPKICKQDN